MQLFWWANVKPDRKREKLLKNSANSVFRFLVSVAVLQHAQPAATVGDGGGASSNKNKT